MDPKETPRVPKRIRQEARSILRHYPGNYYITELARRSPDIIAEEMEEVTKLMKKYELSKEKNHGA
jgi:hypothetical protein